MPIARSKLTARGRISVPAKVRVKLGIGPGSVLEWDFDRWKNRRSARRAGTFDEIHQTLFPEGPPKRRSLKKLKAGISIAVRRKHARR